MKIQKSKNPATPLLMDIIGITTGKLLAIKHALESQLDLGNLGVVGRECLAELNSILALNESFDNAISKAEDDFKKQFNRWAFDERDEVISYDEYVEDHLKRSLTFDERKDVEFKDALKRCIKLADAAEDVAYQSRVGDKVRLAKAETKFQSLK